MTHRPFGTVRRLASGRYQALYFHEGARYVGTFSTVADARAWLAAAEVAIRRGDWRDPDAGRVRLEDYARGWLDRRSDLRPRTKALYEDLLRLHVLPAFGSLTLAAITPAEVGSWHRRLASAHPTTAAKAYRLFAAILSAAVDENRLTRSPARVPGAAVEHAPERPSLDLSDLDALIAAMPERLRVVPLLACWGAMRRAELLGLQRRDVREGIVTITRTRQWVRGAMTLGEPKSAAGRRSVALPPHVVPILDEHLARYVAPEPEAYVIVGDKGGPITAPMLQRHWERAREAIGRPELHLHDLRHAGLTLAAQIGATVAELMHRAGHASPQAALRYQHASRERDQAIAAALSELAEAPNPSARIPRANRPEGERVAEAP